MRRLKEENERKREGVIFGMVSGGEEADGKFVV
jgi:hypothetical protein